MDQHARIDCDGVVHCTSIAVVMRELASDVNWDILAAVAERPRCGHELVRELAITQSTASKSLDRLGQYQLVSYERHKSEHIYRLRAELLRQLREDSLVVEFRASDKSLVLRMLLHTVEP